MKNLVILSGAGISVESGIKTFRDADGLWEGHDIMEVASPYGWKKNPQKVLDFYNQRRRQLFEVYPNKAHKALAELEKHYQVHIITQNVDDLHEPAASLYTHASKDALIYYIDPKAKNAHLPQNVQCINESAVHAMQDLMPKLIEMAS
ncbi:hypothetical protein C2S08_02935 [Helicobacter pylori]|uniref:Sir2 family NAD-dependent protein deacetylase n=1 Tax=Helicobacter pylori TaxID=210 RepID=UPI000D38D5E9|nr:Sir2 family NAD-dependent protein deacetylase [Helicobacter pylori]PUD26165.1 hypothetical protein C2S08_02935 [Helicobacter pylori]